MQHVNSGWIWIEQNNCKELLLTFQVIGIVNFSSNGIVIIYVFLKVLTF